MALESLIGSVKWLDKKVQKQYTKLGKKIPEDHLYKLTTGLCLFGAGAGSEILKQPLPIIYGGMVGLIDLTLNINGLKGDSPTYISGNSLVTNPKYERLMDISRGIRLPLFLSGVGLLGKTVYDTANYFLNGEALGTDTFTNLTSGLGFLSVASSMYFKDQDPKSLEKQPSKIKEFLKGIYERAKGLIPSERPIPEPIPISSYSTLENYFSP